MRIKSWFQTLWPPILAIVALLLIWQGSVMWFGVADWILPAPLAIVQEASLHLERLWLHTHSTLNITIIGFVTGILIGMVMAAILHVVPFLKRAIYPLLVLSQNIPIIALAPLLMIWFGFGLLPKVVIIVLVCFFPVAIAMLGGLNQVDYVMYNYMQMAGSKRGQLFWKLELPSALPSLFSGLKISATYSVMGAVIAEWLGSEKGLGMYMLLSSSSFRTDRVFVAIFIIVTLSILLFGIVSLLEKIFVRWHHTDSSEGGKRR